MYQRPFPQISNIKIRAWYFMVTPYAVLKSFRCFLSDRWHIDKIGMSENEQSRSQQSTEIQLVNIKRHEQFEKSFARQSFLSSSLTLCLRISSAHPISGWDRKETMPMGAFWLSSCALAWRPVRWKQTQYLFSEIWHTEQKTPTKAETQIPDVKLFSGRGHSSY